MSRGLYPGFATIEGSASLARRFGAAARRLGRTELLVTPIGFGTYRAHVDHPGHRQALEEALRAGVNVIDTASNYGDGGGERLVGSVIRRLCDEGVIAREQVVVVTKIGYVQGAALEAARRRDPPFPEVVEYLDDCWHCIHPEYLAEQLEACRERLGLARIDVLLLHNPEYLLIDRRNRRGQIDEVDREALMRRLGAAFRFLERAASDGLVGWYGVSSNTLAAPEGAGERLPLEPLIEAARAVGGEDHRFAVVELPLNLYESAALRERATTAAGPRTALESAAAADLGVLTNRPLNAFVEAPEPRLIRLAEVERGARPQDPAPLLRAVQALEAGWQQGLGRALAETSGDPRYGDLFRWGRELEAGLGSIRDLGHWIRLRNGVIATHMGQLGGILLSTLEGAALESFRGFWEEYGATLQAALDGIEDGFRARAQAVVDQVSERVDAALPAALGGLSLAQKAVLAVLAAPVSCALVGMRQPAYVHEMVELGRWLEAMAADEGAAIDAAAVFGAFAPPALH